MWGKFEQVVAWGLRLSGKLKVIGILCFTAFLEIGLRLTLSIGAWCLYSYSKIWFKNQTLAAVENCPTALKVEPELVPVED